MRKTLKKLALLPLFVGLLATTACDNGDDLWGDDERSDTERLLDLPWSQLTYAQQRQRMEAESINFVREIRDISQDPAIDAIQNFERLINIYSPELPDPIREVSSIKEIFDITTVTGTFTWNNSQQRWNRTAAVNNELRFIFPATRETTTNNATLAFRANNSGITFTVHFSSDNDCWCAEWDNQGWQCLEWVCTDNEDTEMVVYLPESATATLTIGTTEIARIEFGAEYNANEVPQRAVYRMVTNAGYEFLWTVNTRDEEIATFSLRRNNTSLMEGRVRTDMDMVAWEDIGLDALDGEEPDAETVFRLLENADATVRLMNDLTIVYWIDSENYARQMDALWDWDNAEWDRISELNSAEWRSIEDWFNAENERLNNSDICNWSSQDFDWEACDASRSALWGERYTRDSLRMATSRARETEQRREFRTREANIMNQFMRSALVCTEDNFRIAELVARVGRTQDRWNDWVWYDIVIYLRFNNGVYVEAEAYFGTGFDRLISEWNDFIDRFNRD